MCEMCCVQVCLFLLLGDEIDLLLEKLAILANEHQ
jgi:hypothetical protein